MDKYSFETFGRPKRPETYANNTRSDELALIYADYVAQLLEGRSAGARVSREISDSTLAVGGAFLAATETLEISAETVAGIGVGAVIIRELQKIFNAGGRSEAFADAAYLIRQAQSEYRQYNPNPPPDVLTENGAILVSRVDAAVHAARKSLNGRMPGLLDLQQATQPMTKKGADRKSSGTPQTMFTASGVRELPQLRPPVPPGPGVPVPQPSTPEDVLIKQGEVQVLIDGLTGTELPAATVTVMDRLDPPTTSPEGNVTTKYPRNKTGLRRLVGRTRKIEDLNAIQTSL
jgi:hypothetical protein